MRYFGVSSIENLNSDLEGLGVGLGRALDRVAIPATQCHDHGTGESLHRLEDVTIPLC